jgi:hypothetical protein
MAQICLEPWLRLLLGLEPNSSRTCLYPHLNLPHSEPVKVHIPGLLYTQIIFYQTCEHNRMWGSHSGALKSSTFWEITLCSPLRVNWHFGETCCLHLRWSRRSQGRNSRASRTLPATYIYVDILLGLGNMALWNVGWLSTDLHSVISQKAKLFFRTEAYCIKDNCMNIHVISIWSILNTAYIWYRVNRKLLLSLIKHDAMNTGGMEE